MSATRARGEITLSGPPRNMSVVVPLDAAMDGMVPISITVAGHPAIYRALVRPFGSDRSEIRLRLPGDTPPGTYAGESSIGGKPRGIVVEVEPVMRIRVQPKQTVVAAAASAKVEFGVTVLNGGNLPFDVPKSDAFDFDDEAGQDRALGRALRAKLTATERRVDRFFDELKEDHGGEAQVVVKGGAGRLVPGESRELACVLEVPATVQQGRRYVGTWQLGNGAHVIVAEIRTSGPLKRGRRKNKRAKT